MNRLARFCLVSLFFFSLAPVAVVLAYPANVNVVFIDQVMRWSPEVGEPLANHFTIHLRGDVGWDPENNCHTAWVVLPDGDTQMYTTAIAAMMNSKPVVVTIAMRAVSYTTSCWAVGISVFEN